MTTVTVATDERTKALLRNDLSSMTKEQIAGLVAELSHRMGVDPALAPIDIIVDKKTGKASLYINARGAAELAKRHELTDESLDIDIRDKVVIAKVAKADPAGRLLRDVGAAPFNPEWPDSLAKAIKQAVTSAHRRATMRMVGIFLNEPEDLADAGEG